MNIRKIILSLTPILMVLSANAQSKFEVKDFGGFKLHSYVTADPLGDMSYIIEGKNGIVVLEPVAFSDNIKEFGEYIAKLNKRVEKVIVNYHAAGFSGFDHSKFVMVEGMPEFKFFPGASTDFPAASILIGGEVYYMHFAPVANMHMSALQIPDRKAVDATLAELEHAKASGVTTFIGGHGAGVGNINAVNFQIEYLKKVKETISLIKTGDEFILVMQMTYQDIAGDDNLTALATNLYK